VLRVYVGQPEVGIEIAEVIGTPDQAVSHVVAGDYLYVADLNGGLRIIEL